MLVLFADGWYCCNWSKTERFVSPQPHKSTDLDTCGLSLVVVEASPSVGQKKMKKRPRRGNSDAASPKARPDAKSSAADAQQALVAIPLAAPKQQPVDSDSDYAKCSLSLRRCIC